MHPQPPQYETQLGYYLENASTELTQGPDRSKIANLSKVYPTGMEGTTRSGEESFVSEKAIYFPMNPVVERISDAPGTKDPTPMRTVAENYIAGRRRAIESPVAVTLNRRSTVNHFIWMEATPVMITTISWTGRMAETVAVTQSTADEYPHGIEIPTRMIPPRGRQPRYQNDRIS